MAETKDKFTPGPWIVEYAGDKYYRIIGEDGKGAQITELDRHLGPDAPNVRLIAASPLLLAELRNAVENCGCSIAERDSGHLVGCYVPSALDAIAKATQPETR